MTAPAIATEPVKDAVAEIVCPLMAPDVIVSAPMSIAPKPEVIEPVFRAPVPVIAVLTASLVSTRAASLPSSLSSSAEEMVAPEVTMSLAPILIAVPISASETSNAVVIEPPAATLTNRPVPIVKLVSRFSIRRSWVEASVEAPSFREMVTVLSAIISISKLESATSSDKVMSISLAVVVARVAPPV